MEPVTVVVPVLRRPHRAEPFMASLRESVTSADEPPVIAVANVGDGDTAEAWRRAGAMVMECPDEPGSFGQKLNWLVAKSRAIDLGGIRPARWMFVTGDDVCFHPGWLEAALTDLPDTACVVGTNDLGTTAVQDGEHATHMFLRMDYVRDQGASWDGPGTVAGPYRHWWTDDEMVTLAKLRGVWEMRSDSIVEHLHPLFDRGTWDETYQIGAEASFADRTLFNDRLRRFAPEEWRRRQPAVVDLT